MRLLAKEKELTRLRDELSAERRKLPWTPVEKPYTFDSTEGKVTLAQLFGTRSQLCVYHYMFAPDWETPCKSCTFWADGFDRVPEHLAQRDVAFVAISRAPLEKLRAFAQRLGFHFKWVSSYESDFNHDLGVSFDPAAVARGEARYNYAPFTQAGTERPGASVFAKDEHGRVFHTYSSYGRGIDALNPAYQWLDLVPKGRDESELPMPMAWVRFRDQYGK